MAYSLDLRKKVMEYRKSNSLDKTHETFKISKTTILDWEKLLKTTGSLKKRPLIRSHKKIDPDKLAEYIVDKPDAYLREMADHFGCTIRAVSQALDKQQITLKKLKFVMLKQMKKSKKSS
jgi:transposase